MAPPDIPTHTQARVINAIMKRPWAITEDWLSTILSIAHRDNLSVQAVEAQLGRPLDNTHDVTVRNGVATIPVEGPLLRYADMFSAISGATSIAALSTDFHQALSDPQIRAIVLYVDSPGGEVNGTNELASMVYDARGTKTVIAYLADHACSAAYWIASAADEVVVADTAVVGSIGVVAAVADPSADDADEVVFVSSQSPNKRAHPDTESGKAQIQTVVDDLAAVFVTSVARNRNVSEDTVLADFGQGGVFVGQKAVDAGLADRVGTYEGILAELVQPAQPLPFPSKTAPSTAATTNQKHAPAHRSRPMSSFTDWIFGKAQEEGIELDRSEIEAAFDGKQPAAIADLQAKVTQKDQELAALREAQEQHTKQLAQAALDKRTAEATTYTDRLVSSYRLPPAAAEPFKALAIRAAALDAEHPVQGDDASTRQLLDNLTAALPDLTLFTKPQLEDPKIAAYFSQTTTDTGTSDKPNAEVVDRILKATPDGRKILAERSNTKA